jgi:hypothetical protein
MSPVLVVGAARSDERLPDIEEEMLKEVPHRGEAARFTIQSRGRHDRHAAGLDLTFLRVGNRACSGSITRR